MPNAALYREVVERLGGDVRLKALGARVCADDDAHVSVRLLQPNPRGVRSVIIRACANGFYEMECFGALRPASFSAPRIGHAAEIIPENLATVLVRLTGAESLHRLSI